MKRILPLQLISLCALSLLVLVPQENSSRKAHARPAFNDGRALNLSSGDSIIFEDGFEVFDPNWGFVEEIVDTMWYRDDTLGNANRVMENPKDGMYSFKVWANQKDSLCSNHVIGGYKLADNGILGNFVYSMDAYVPATSNTGQTGPEFSVQSTRETCGQKLTYIAGVQYVESPFDAAGKIVGSRWNIWHNGTWITLLPDTLPKGKWYHFELEFDYDANRYLRFAASGAGHNFTLDLTRPAAQAPHGYQILGESKCFQPALEITLEAENLFTACVRATQYCVYYDNVQLKKRMVARFRDDFSESALNRDRWEIRHGMPYIENGKLKLTSSLSPPVKTEIQSRQGFLYGSLEFVASSTHWQSDSADRKIDTSIGLETFYDKDCHDGIVVTNGTLGVLRSFPISNNDCGGKPVFQKYFGIPNWETLRKTANKYRIDWSSESISLWINDVIALSCVSVPHDSMPNRPMMVRLNCNVDLTDNKRVSKDTLCIDSVCSLSSSPGTAVANPRVERLPSNAFLEQNYPNPFNPSTNIRFSLPRASLITLIVFNLAGQEVATLLNEPREAGVHSLNWNARGLPSGIYFYRLQAGEFKETRKLLLLR